MKTKSMTSQIRIFIIAVAGTVLLSAAARAESCLWFPSGPAYASSKQEAKADAAAIARARGRARFHIRSRLVGKRIPVCTKDIGRKRWICRVQLRYCGLPPFRPNSG